jgi:hypothetical protein
MKDLNLPQRLRVHRESLFFICREIPANENLPPFRGKEILFIKQRFPFCPHDCLAELSYFAHRRLPMGKKEKPSVTSVPCMIKVNKIVL